MFKKRNKTRITEILFALAIFAMLAVFALGIRYSLPVIDDYHFYYMFKNNFHYPNVFAAAFSQAFWMYCNFQGAWFTNHLDMFAVGITGLNTVGVRIYLLISFILFVFSFFYFFNSLKNLFKTEKQNIATLIMIFVFVFTGMNLIPAREELYWLTGVGGYTIPLSFAFIGIGNYIKLVKEMTTKRLIVVTVCFVLASGGALNIAGFACAVGLCISLAVAIGIVGNLSGIKHKIEFCLPFIAGTISALLNVASPGNFSRLEFESGKGLSIFDAILATVKLLVGRFYMLYKRQYLILTMIFLFFVMLIYIKENILIDKKSLFYVFASLVFVLFVSFFPVCLGYGRITTVDRILFLVDMEIVIALEIVVLMLAIYIREYFSENVKRINYIVLVPLLVLSAYLNLKIVGVSDLMIYQTVKDYSNGTLSEFEKNENMILKSIIESNDKKVSVEVDYVESSVLLRTGVGNDESHWVNGVVAAVFDKDSISVNYR